MKPHHRSITAAAIALALAIPYLTLPSAVVAQKQLDIAAQKIEERDRKENGITVHEPRVFDDAQLQQRLQELEARLAVLQVIDQKAITDRLGTLAGASARTSGFAINVQGAPVPAVDTTTKLPTEQVKTTTAPGATSSNVETTTTLGVEDVVTKAPQFNPPTATAPASNVSMPTSFSVSSSDVLDEMTQLQAEINGLRLLLSGDLSSHYIRGGPGVGNQMTKFKTTLGFNISVKPDGVQPEERYKDAVAVVEVEVENVCETISDEPPAITALLPREKTYNVAEITDKSTSIGAGVATQIVGFSGSWVRGHKTHYLVRDQDTIALTFTPEEPMARTCRVPGCEKECQKKCQTVTDEGDKATCEAACKKERCSRASKRVGFMWQFRPVLGRRYVRIAEKTTFVQLAFPVPADVGEEGEAGEIGRVTVRTYWRGYDRKRRVHKEVIGGSVNEQVVNFDIPRYKLAVSPGVFNFQHSVEDLGGGQLLVKLPGRFLPGTNVRIGPTVLTEGDRFKHRYSSIRFVATASDLATKKVFLVAHDGTEVPLEIGAPAIIRTRTDPVTSRPIQFSVPVCGVTTEKNDKGKVIRRHTTEFEVPTAPVITTVDEANSRVRVPFVIKRTTLDVETRTETVERFTPDDNDEIPGLVLSVGSRAFGYSDGPLTRSGNVLEAIVPSALLAANPNLTLQLLFPQKQCRKNVTLSAFSPPSQTERLSLLEQGEKTVKFLLFGTRLTNLTVLAPADSPELPVSVKAVGNPADADRLLLIEVAAGHLKTHKNLLVQRKAADERPFLIPIPSLEAPKKPDPPKALERVTVGSEEAVIIGEGLKEVAKVFFRKRQFDPADIEIGDDGKSLRLLRLTRLGVTATAATQPLVLEFKSGAKVTVNLEVVTTKVETVTK